MLFDKKTAVVTGGAKGIADYEHIDYLINNALPLVRGINDCT